MNKDISLLALRLFIDVAGTGSFTAAGRRHDLPASSVSRHMARLEGTLGQRLLHRSTRSVRLSDQGATFLAEVSTAIEAMDRATDNLRGGRLAPL